jgi:hypothetical protein
MEGVRQIPYTPLELAGRDIYVREGCYNCHSQMIRTLVGDVLRYGDYSNWARAFTIIPINGARSAPARIWPAKAGSTERLALQSHARPAHGQSWLHYAKLPVVV